MSEHRVKVDNGKYEFCNRGGWRVDVLRHGEQWVHDLDASKAVTSMMAELDAARLVLTAARAALPNGGEMPDAIVAALELHDRLCDDSEPPSPWATP